MEDYRYTVFHVGVHTQEALEPEKIELAKIGARQVVLPSLKTEDEMLAQTRGADGLIIMESDVSRRTMEASPNCKVVLRTGVGVDTIDIPAATDLGIAVINVPDVWIREVANHALALMLACNRRLFLLDRTIRGGGWPRVIPSPVGSLHGETLGVVGLGQIGRALVRRAAAFEMDLIAHDPYIEPSVFAEYGVEQVSFEELLARSDYVSIHTPLTDDTHYMFDEAAFRQMKPTAYLINTARGPIVEMAALVEALRSGRIFGAGIDVFEVEPPPDDSPLLGLDNVVLSSHSGYYSDPALRALSVRCGQEVARVLTGRMPLHLVNPEVLGRLPLVSG
jgi:D-3-phosphoglycerate dehydrogenase